MFPHARRGRQIFLGLTGALLWTLSGCGGGGGSGTPSGSPPGGGASVQLALNAALHSLNISGAQSVTNPAGQNAQVSLAVTGAGIQMGGSRVLRKVLVFVANSNLQDFYMIESGTATTIPNGGRIYAFIPDDVPGDNAGSLTLTATEIGSGTVLTINLTATDSVNVSTFPSVTNPNGQNVALSVAFAGTLNMGGTRTLTKAAFFVANSNEQNFFVVTQAASIMIPNGGRIFGFIPDDVPGDNTGTGTLTANE